MPVCAHRIVRCIVRCFFLCRACRLPDLSVVRQYRNGGGFGVEFRLTKINLRQAFVSFSFFGGVGKSNRGFRLGKRCRMGVFLFYSVSCGIGLPCCLLREPLLPKGFRKMAG